MSEAAVVTAEKKSDGAFLQKLDEESLKVFAYVFYPRYTLLRTHSKFILCRIRRSTAWNRFAVEAGLGSV